MWLSTSIWKQATRRILLKQFCYMFNVLSGYFDIEIQRENKKVKNKDNKISSLNEIE